MLNELLLLLGLVAPDLTGSVAVRAAYVINTSEEIVPERKCCGLCDGGKVTHGDGHVTDCPCPKDCVCKQASEKQSICKPVKR